MKPDAGSRPPVWTFKIAGISAAQPAITIWSDMDDRELDSLIGPWLARAQTSGRAAKLAQQAVTMHQDMIVPGLVVLPRAWQTFTLIMQNGLRTKP